MRDNFSGIGMCAADRLSGEVARCDAYPAGNKVDDVAHHNVALTHCGRVSKICVFNTVKLGTSASSP